MLVYFLLVTLCVALKNIELDCLVLALLVKKMHAVETEVV